MYNKPNDNYKSKLRSLRIKKNTSLDSNSGSNLRTMPASRYSIKNIDTSNTNDDNYKKLLYSVKSSNKEINTEDNTIRPLYQGLPDIIKYLNIKGPDDSLNFDVDKTLESIGSISNTIDDLSDSSKMKLLDIIYKVVNKVLSMNINAIGPFLASINTTSTVPDTARLLYLLIKNINHNDLITPKISKSTLENIDEVYL